MTKKMLKKLITIKYRERTDTISGILLAFNENFTLLLCNPVDFVLDGFIILKTQNIIKFKYGKEEKFIQKVIGKYDDNLPDVDINLEFSNILESISMKYKVIGIELKDESKIYIGEFAGSKKSILYLRELSPSGVWSENPRTFDIKKIRLIQFDSHYINSLYNYSISHKND